MIIKRMNLKLLYAAAALLCSLRFAEGGSVTVKGSGPGYGGQEIRVSMQSDPLTLRHKPVLRVRADEKGYFSFSINIEEGTEIIFLKSGVYCFYLYTAPGKYYDILLPPYRPKPVSEDQNPFFRETEIIPVVVNDSSDVNNLIRKFDSVYNPVFNQVAERIFMKYGMKDISGLTEKLGIFSDTGGNSFYADYVRFRMSELDLIKMNSHDERIKAAAFINDRFIPENPAYTDLVGQLFGGYFTGSLKDASSDQFPGAVYSASINKLRELVANDNRITNMELTDYVILSGFYNLYSEGKFPGDVIITSVSAMKTAASSRYLGRLADIVLERMLQTHPGQPAPDFSLKNTDGETVSPKYFNGRFVLLNFAETVNPVTISEFEIIKGWGGKYEKDLAVVTVLTGSDYAAGLEKMKDKGCDWTILDGSTADDTEYKYGIKFYPVFILLDRFGRIVSNPCNYPSENLETSIRKTLLTQ
jgi:hypothetical protein